MVEEGFDIGVTDKGVEFWCGGGNRGLEFMVIDKGSDIVINDRRGLLEFWMGW